MIKFQTNNLTLRWCIHRTWWILCSHHYKGMKSKDLEMCKINKTKINNYLSPIRSFSMYSIVSRYHYNEWIYVIWDIAGLDWLMCDLLNGVYQLVRRGDLTWLLHLLICVYMIVQQIDHLFLHISLGRISSFFLFDLHS